MKTNPLVTVIIPNYNHAPYLRERIDSVLAQDYDNFEVIILDDCSTDNSRDIIMEYEGREHVSKIVLNDKNTGNTFIQWDKGIGLAKGEYIWIAESDDVARPQLLPTLAGELQKHPEATVAYCHSRLIDSDGNVLVEQNSRCKEADDTVRIHDGREYLKGYLLAFNYIYNASMAVFRKSAFAGVDREFMKLRYCGDWHFWASICVQGTVVEAYAMLNDFRQHRNKVTVRASADTRRRMDEAVNYRHIAALAQLSAFERRCLRGRLTKRLGKDIRGGEIPLGEAEELKATYPDIYGGGWTDIALYEIGKHTTGFLKYRQKFTFLAECFANAKKGII